MGWDESDLAITLTYFEVKSQVGCTNCKLKVEDCVLMPERKTITPMIDLAERPGDLLGTGMLSTA